MDYYRQAVISPVGNVIAPDGAVIYYPYPYPYPYPYYHHHHHHHYCWRCGYHHYGWW